ncbi:FAD-binding monooxygenase [Mycobacterium sp. 1245801.1]|nr:FAD-binding monooxygenase [Mycobacterium sp. 1245801.1]
MSPDSIAAATKGASVADCDVQVLIVGGGAAGLAASLSLAQLEVDTYLVSSRETTSPLPKAHILNQRTMEMFRGLGVDSEIYEKGTPAHQMVYTGFYVGFAGDQPECGHRLYRLESFGAGGRADAWRLASPSLPANLPQSRLEPILRRRAEKASPERLHYGHELISVEQDSEAVSAAIIDHKTGEQYTVRAQYLLACDGGRTVGPALGVVPEGLSDLGRMVTIHLSVDLSRWASDSDVLLRFHRMPDTGRFVIMAPMGPTHWGPKSEEWCIHLTYPIDDPRSLDDAKVMDDMRATLGVGHLDCTVHVITRWVIEGTVADRFRLGRVFILGDAAHRHPPTGGLGLNSAIHDADNLAWKLAFVLADNASPRLLDTYEAERKPVSATNVQRSIENTLNHLRTSALIGIEQSNSPEVNWSNVRRLWSEDPADAAHRRQVMQALAAQTMEFNEHNIEYGYTYSSDCVISDGSAAPQNPDPIRIYQPAARPGHPLPHTWLSTPDGQRIAVMDLVAPGRFLLIAAQEGHAWVDAAKVLAQRWAVPIDAVRIGHTDGDYLDFRSTWTQWRGHGERGAVLVRPDRFIAWRAQGLADDPFSSLCEVVASILGPPAIAETTAPPAHTAQNKP